MIPRRDALRHSPALWGLCAGLAAFTGLAIVTVGWNAWEYRADIARWVKF